MASRQLPGDGKFSLLLLGIRQSEPLPQQAIYLGLIGIRILSADAFTRYVAGQLVQLQRNAKALLARHAPVTLNLPVQCCCRRHGLLINQFLAAYNFNFASVATLAIA
jgi:hypothetical protein